jgi:putative oxidoreductase
MHRWSDMFAPLIGRILMGGFFLWNGIETTLNFPAAASKIATAGSPEPIALTLLFISIQVLGGIALVVGFKTRQVALVLALYTIITAFLYTDFSNDLQQSLFLQSIAIVGGLLYISAFGSGLWAIEWRKKRY